ncbi:MAG: hypothetical protein QOJ03_2630 [Frankiaceae bacterium]|nr:hypothetical protein [Frankiaceae bacterium]
MNRRAAVATVTSLALGAATLTPALAATGRAKPKPIKGKWSYSDFTPDPTVSVVNSAKMTDPHCAGALPSAPSDVNSHIIKVAGRGTLTVNGANTGDWAMEVLNSKGVQLANSDGPTPQDKEGVLLSITKAGRYKVVFCNLGGAPTASATYSYKYR